MSDRHGRRRRRPCGRISSRDGTAVQFPSEGRAHHRDHADEIPSEILNFVGLSHRAEELAGNLAYGEQRLLGIAIALAADPKLLLLDEPAAGLNPSETEAFMAVVQRIRDRGVTILLVEHDMRMVMTISDRVVVLNHGRIIAEGSPEVIRANPDVIQAYLGQGVKHAKG